jgi:hypothetical protein
VVVSTHAAGEPHSIWPATEQPQVLFVQVAPAGHLFPQDPQFSASFVRFAQLPPAHCVCPLAQLFEQALLLQTMVPEQVVVQLPQWLLSDETQALLQKRAPLWHWQLPPEHVCPVAQTFPHPPQFWGSVVTFTQEVPQASSPLPQLGPVAGFAQLATKTAQPRQATSADKRVLRASMVRLLLGGASRAGFRLSGGILHHPEGAIVNFRSPR